MCDGPHLPWQIRGGSELECRAVVSTLLRRPEWRREGRRGGGSNHAPRRSVLPGRRHHMEPWMIQQRVGIIVPSCSTIVVPAERAWRGHLEPSFNRCSRAARVHHKRHQCRCQGQHHPDHFNQLDTL